MTDGSALGKIKAFVMTNQLVTEDILKVGVTYSIDLGILSGTSKAVEDVYFPQFDAAVRAEADGMGRHYAVFYCLEKSIRTLVAETIEAAEKTSEWWESSRISQNIKDEVATRFQKERDSGVTPRSDDELDYTTFGELSQIITSNWDLFGSLFSSRKAVERVMANLNTLRGPIAHCSLLAEDEIVRLQLTVRDWFRLME